MSTTLVLHELTPSPNNLKVRMALGFKGLAYERVPFVPDGMPGDRSKYVELSGQPRTPILVHGETVIYDSNGIARYLDANVKRDPSLFSTDYAEMGEIETWEFFARSRASQAVGMLFGLAIAGEVDAEVVKQANAAFHDATGELQDAIAATGFLVAGRTTNADLANVALANLGMLSDAYAASSPILAFFREHLALGDDRAGVRAWVERHLAYDAD